MANSESSEQPHSRQRHSIATPILLVFGLMVLAAILFAVFHGPDKGPDEDKTPAPSETVTTSVAAATPTQSEAASAEETSADETSAPESRKATTEATHADGIAPCDDAELPDEAFDTIDDILAGGPFAYPANDGSRFGNYEQLLPNEPKGYYREYTVDTPGLNHRGERRIVTGGKREQDPDVWYYTEDHYESFCEVISVD